MHADEIVAAVNTFGRYQLVKLSTRRSLSLRDVFLQSQGRFLVLFQWQQGTEQGYHYVSVCCNSRWLFCSQLEAVPLNMSEIATIPETGKTHQRIKKRVKNVNWVWALVLRAQ